MKTRYFIFIATFLLFSFTTNAQNKKKASNIILTGTITDFSNKPLKGVFIYIDSIKTKARTNKDGFYKVKTKSSISIITAYSVNHGLLSVSYSGENKISFVFSDDSSVIDRNELAKLGFSDPIRKRSGKVSFEGVKGLNGFNNIYQLIEGTISGVTVKGERISIRGANTSSTSGSSTQPLFIVDGMPVTSITYIVPSDVKSIEAIKGPEAAFYGSRGVYGVIKIILKN